QGITSCFTPRSSAHAPALPKQFSVLLRSIRQSLSNNFALSPEAFSIRERHVSPFSSQGTPCKLVRTATANRCHSVRNRGAVNHHGSRCTRGWFQASPDHRHS